MGLSYIGVSVCHYRWFGESHCVLMGDLSLYRCAFGVLVAHTAGFRGLLCGVLDVDVLGEGLLRLGRRSIPQRAFRKRAHAISAPRAHLTVS